MVSSTSPGATQEYWIFWFSLIGLLHQGQQIPSNQEFKLKKKRLCSVIIMICPQEEIFKNFLLFSLHYFIPKINLANLIFFEKLNYFYDLEYGVLTLGTIHWCFSSLEKNNNGNNSSLDHLHLKSKYTSLFYYFMCVGVCALQHTFAGVCTSLKRLSDHLDVKL